MFRPGDRVRLKVESQPIRAKLPITGVVEAVGICRRDGTEWVRVLRDGGKSGVSWAACHWELDAERKEGA